jgi:hypothetical protein
MLTTEGTSEIYFATGRDSGGWPGRRVALVLVVVDVALPRR